jgi:protein-S-isoprenylcysteine O-methyltransferase Ste14
MPERFRPVNSLELKIPPPVVAVVLMAAMWAISQASSPIDSLHFVRVSAAIAIAAIGLGIDISALISFRRAHTTVNPMKPGKTSSLVTTGIFRYTRNPMYVGLLLVLFGWALFLPSDWALVGPLAFVLYIGRFQIAPEERVLSGLFGEQFSEYMARVRRWV